MLVAFVLLLLLCRGNMETSANAATRFVQEDVDTGKYDEGRKRRDRAATPWALTGLFQSDLYPKVLGTRLDFHPQAVNPIISGLGPKAHRAILCVSSWKRGRLESRLE